jgi:two-component system LytT family response regulator
LPEVEIVAMIDSPLEGLEKIKALKDVEEILEGADFFRIHASCLINMKHVTKFTRGDGGYVVMSNNQYITVSRKKKDNFFEMFSKI